MSAFLTKDRSAESNSPPGRAELILVILISLVGLGLRSAYPSRLAVEHFDEGVYASNLFFHDGAGTGRYPDQHLYAPPLLPFLIECAMIVFGATNPAAMTVSIAAGALTVPLMWWVGRRWFGPAAGLTAALVTALNDVHIFFSRTALTDVLLCFFLVWAVHFFHKALSSRNRLALIAAGAATGLAWWTKYNGWLPLAIGLSGLVPWKLWGNPGVASAGQSPRHSLVNRASKLSGPLTCWSFVALTACLLWLPWLWSLQEKGGYSAVAANHRGYFLGLSEWTHSFATLARKLTLLDGQPTGCSLLAVVLVSIGFLRLEDRRFTWNLLLFNDVVFFTLPVAGLVSVIDGASVIMTTLGAIGIFIGLSRRLAGHDAARLDDTDRSRGALGIWLLTAWFAGLLLTIPLYTPYPRLMLPWLVASWLGTGILVDAIVGRIRSHAHEMLAVDRGMQPLLLRKRPNSVVLARSRPAYILAMGAAIVLAAGQRSPLQRGVPGWESRTGLADLAPEILDDACRNAGLDRQTQLNKFVIYTYGEPALVFNLRLAGAEFVNPVKDVMFANPDAPEPVLPSFIVIGPQAWRTPGFGEQLARALPRLQLAGKYRYVPSALVVLDGFLIRSDRRTEHAIELYRVK
jgi:hypothetical protein